MQHTQEINLVEYVWEPVIPPHDVIQEFANIAEGGFYKNPMLEWQEDLRKKGYLELKGEVEGITFRFFGKRVKNEPDMLGKEGYFRLSDLSEDEIEDVENVVIERMSKKIRESIHKNKQTRMLMDDSIDLTYTVSIDFDSVCEIVNGMRARNDLEI